MSTVDIGAPIIAAPTAANPQTVKAEPVTVKPKTVKILAAAAPPLAPINNAGEKTPPNKPKPIQIAVIRILRTTSINKK